MGLAPGIELDALVEEKVFDKVWPMEILTFVEEPEHWHCVNYSEKRGAPFINDRLPRYSTSDSAAMSVLEKLNYGYYDLNIQNDCEGHTPDVWYIRLTGDIKASAPTLPHAISLVAQSK